MDDEEKVGINKMRGGNEDGRGYWRRRLLLPSPRGSVKPSAERETQSA